MLLLCVGLAGGLVWFTASTSAHLRMLKSWERLFGLPKARQASASHLAIRPQAVSGIGGYTLTSFDVAGAGTGLANGTIGVSIDAAGDIAGTYVDSGLVGHGFLRTANGSVTEFDAPGAGTGPMQGTFAIAIAPTGSYIAGMYADANNSYHGFLRNSSGVITGFDAGPFDVHQGTIVTGVNSSGTVTGVYSAGTFEAFVRTVDGTITLFEAPDAGPNSQPQGTIAISINSSGSITGLYIDANNVSQGFVRSAGGAITEFGIPCQGTSCFATTPMAIDDLGDIVGAYGAAGSFSTVTSTGQPTTALGHGFIRLANGTITTFDPPGSVVGTSLVGGIIGGTLPLSIDPGGNYVVGFYSDAANVEHGFIRSPTDITTFDAPGASASMLPLSGTGAAGVNASGAISGAYVDSAGIFHGLLLSPSGGYIPGFKLTNSGGVTVTAGNGGTSTLTVTPSGGFTGAVDFTCSVAGSPMGVTCSAPQVKITNGSPATSTLALTTSTATAAGSYQVTVTGTDAASGKISSATILTLTVQAGSTPAFKLTNSGAITVTAGDKGTSTLTVTPLAGFTGAVNFACSFPGSATGVTCQAPPASISNASPASSTLTISTSVSTPPGIYSATITGSDTTGKITASTTLTFTVTSFMLSAQSASISVAQGSTSTADTITISPLNGFSGAVTLAATGLPSGVTAAFAPNPTSNTSNLTLTASASAAVTSTPVPITISGTSDLLSVTTTIALTITAVAGIVDPTPPGPLTITAGATTGNTATISLQGTNGFSGTVSLACNVSTKMTNVNDAPTCSLNPSSATISGTTAQTSTLTVTTTARSSASNSTRKLLWPSAGGVTLALILFFRVPRQGRHWFATLCLLMFVCSIGAIGCGGSGGGGGGGGGGASGTTAGAYTITVTGTVATVQTTIATISLTVQ